MCSGNRIPAAALAGLLLLASAAAAIAQDDGDGAGLLGLTIPIGARPVGQGRAIAAVRGELQGAPYNPASLVGLERGSLTYSRYEAADLAELNSNYLAGAYVTAWGTIGATAVYQDYGQIPLTIDSPEPIGTVDLNEWSIGVTYANEWRDRLAYAATAKWVRSDFGVVEASGPAFDLGVIYSPRPTLPMSFAISLRNLGPDLDFEDGDVAFPGGGGGDGGEPRQESLPSRVRVGLSAHPDEFLGLPPDFRVQLLFDIESDLRELSTSSQHAGASLILHDVVVLRGGVLLADNPFIESGEGDRQFGGSFGIGFRHAGFEADIAREVSVSELGDETHFGVGYRF
ncbi:MAG TPA: PorV/PorQ family protein [Gemmatimonadota bacterium]|nr:PorV/PorQ family protein [Gemmatimonadota bacterium]